MAGWNVLEVLRTIVTGVLGQTPYQRRDVPRVVITSVVQTFQ
jgi:hypothetical protein